MHYSLIDRCRGCHANGNLLKEVFRMEPMPLAGVFCRTSEEAKSAPAIPLTWLECSACGLIQVLENVPDEVLFTAYNYASSSIAGLVRHFEAFAQTLIRQYGESPRTYLEIGSNDGVLLRRLPTAWRRIGVDPCDVAARAAVGAPYELANEPFTVAAVERLGLTGKIDALSGSNCLAHVSDMQAIFAAAAAALRPGGDFWIEVHDLEALLADAQWDTIYHEHKGEWSEQALRNCLALCGFAWRSTERLPMHGGAIRVRCERLPGGGRPLMTTAPTPGLDRLRHAYAHRLDHPSVRRMLQLRQAGQIVAAYGAAGRANVYLNQVPELQFDYIVDEAPLRIGRFIPRVATPIVPPTQLSLQPPAACLITAWNYRTDIIRKTTQWSGEWLTAFPPE